MGRCPSNDHPLRFTAPGPLCPEVAEGDRKSRYPLLAVVFWDAEGREGDTNFGPLLADLEARSAPAAEEVTLPAGGTWSHDYPTAGFRFFGPGGPAANVQELLRPGQVELSMALEVVEVKPRREGPPGVETEVQSEDQPARRRTNAVTIRVEEAPLIFRRYTDEYQAELLALQERFEEVLSEMGVPDHTPQEIAETIRLFDSPDFSLHALAAGTLCRLGPQAKDAVPRLIEILKGSKMYGDRVLAARVLGAIGPGASPAVPALEAAQSDPQEHVRQEAFAALAKVQGKVELEAVDPTTGEPLVWGKPLRHWIAKMRMGSRGPDDRDFMRAFGPSRRWRSSARRPYPPSLRP